MPTSRGGYLPGGPGWISSLDRSATTISGSWSVRSKQPTVLIISKFVGRVRCERLAMDRVYLQFWLGLVVPVPAQVGCSLPESGCTPVVYKTVKVSDGRA